MPYRREQVRRDLATYVIFVVSTAEFVIVEPVDVEPVDNDRRKFPLKKGSPPFAVCRSSPGCRQTVVKETQHQLQASIFPVHLQAF
jgi:hypothetical protein